MRLRVQSVIGKYKLTKEASILFDANTMAHIKQYYPGVVFDIMSPDHVLMPAGTIFNIKKFIQSLHRDEVSVSITKKDNKGNPWAGFSPYLHPSSFVDFDIEVDKI